MSASSSSRRSVACSSCAGSTRVDVVALGDVGDALRGVEDGEEVRLVAHRLHRADAIDEIGERRRPSRLHRRGDLVVGELPRRRFEDRAHALGEKREQVVLSCALPCASP